MVAGVSQGRQTNDLSKVLVSLCVLDLSNESPFLERQTDGVV